MYIQVDTLLKVKHQKTLFMDVYKGTSVIQQILLCGCTPPSCLYTGLWVWV